MNYIEWDKEKYSVGIDSIDEQHKNLFSILNEIYTEYQEDNEDVELLNNTLTKLIDYVSYHFNAEEKLLQQYDYPEIDEHKIEHKKFERYIKDLNINKTSSNASTITKALINYLFNWIEKHIIEIDGKYAKYLSK